MAQISLRERLALRMLGYRQPTGRKQSLASPVILAQGPFQARWMSSDYETYSREGYLGNPYVFAAVSQIASAVGGIPWKFYTDSTKKTELDQHPMKKLFARPNPLMGGGDFWKTFTTYLLIDGNTYVERAPNGPAPLELWPLRPDRMRIVPGDPKNLVSGYIYRAGGAEITYPQEVVMHLKLVNPLNDWYGASPMMAISKSVDQSNQSKAWNVSLLQNGAQPSGTWVTEQMLDPDQYQRIREQIEERYAGFMNAGRPSIMEGGATWVAQGTSPIDMAWEAGQKLSAREIAMGYNIAPELIGDPESKTFSNYQEARKALMEENVLPFCDVARDMFNGWLSPLFDGAYMDYDADGIEVLHENQDAVYTRNNAAFAAGWITINDARDAAGLDEDKVYGAFYKWQVPVAAAFDTANGMYAIFDPDTEERRDPDAVPPAPPTPALPYPNLPADHTLNAGPPQLTPPAEPGKAPAAAKTPPTPGKTPAVPGKTPAAKAPPTEESKGLIPFQPRREAK